MAIEDLDLEFEDEEELEKSDALDVDVDLSFSASGSNQKAQAQAHAGPKTSVSASEATNPNLRIPPKQTQAQTPTKPQGQPARTPTRQPTQPSQNVQASAKPNVQQRPQSPPGGNVKNIADHRKVSEVQKAVNQARVQTQQVPIQTPHDGEDYAYELQLLRDEIAELKTQMNSIQAQANVKVAVAEAKSEFVIEYVIDAKLADHQVNQVLQRIHKKVPGLKSEVLMIKKFMSEFIEKTNKKKKD